MLHVYLAIDHRIVRDAVAAALRAEPGIDVVETSVDSVTDSAVAAAVKPDVIVLSEPPGEPPESRVARYREAAPTARIVLLSLAYRAVDLEDRAGADAVVDAEDGLDALAAAVRSVAGP